MTLNHRERESFSRSRVEMDSSKFSNCYFENCTLVAKDPPDLQDCRLYSCTCEGPGWFDIIAQVDEFTSLHDGENRIVSGMILRVAPAREQQP